MTETTRRDLLRFTAATAVIGAAGGALGPDAIRGRKWRGAQLTPPPNPELTARFDTRGLPYATAAFSLANNNLDTVVLRVANMADLPDNTTKRQRDDEVVKLLRELHRQGVKTYLFKRQWFQRSGINISYQRPFGEAGADEFIDDMSRLVNRAR